MKTFNKIILFYNFLIIGLGIICILLLYNFIIEFFLNLKPITPFVIGGTIPFIIYIFTRKNDLYKIHKNKTKLNLDQALEKLDGSYLILSESIGREMKKAESYKMHNCNESLKICIDWMNDEKNINHLNKNQRSEIFIINDLCKKYIDRIITEIFLYKSFKIKEDFHIEISRIYYLIYEKYQYFNRIL